MTDQFDQIKDSLSSDPEAIAIIEQLEKHVKSVAVSRKRVSEAVERKYNFGTPEMELTDIIDTPVDFASGFQDALELLSVYFSMIDRACNYVQRDTDRDYFYQMVIKSISKNAPETSNRFEQMIMPVELATPSTLREVVDLSKCMRKQALEHLISSITTSIEKENQRLAAIDKDTINVGMASIENEIVELTGARKSFEQDGTLPKNFEMNKLFVNASEHFTYELQLLYSRLHRAQLVLTSSTLPDLKDSLKTAEKELANLVQDEQSD